MTRYEYRIINISRCRWDDDPWEATESRLQEAGAEGWELVCVDAHNHAYLKRPVRPQRSEIDEENINRMTPSNSVNMTQQMHSDMTEQERKQELEQAMEQGKAIARKMGQRLMKCAQDAGMSTPGILSGSAVIACNLLAHVHRELRHTSDVDIITKACEEIKTIEAMNRLMETAAGIDYLIGENKD